jgi:hypothetical protein
VRRARAPGVTSQTGIAEERLYQGIASHLPGRISGWGRYPRSHVSKDRSSVSVGERLKRNGKTRGARRFGTRQTVPWFHRYP